MFSVPPDLEETNLKYSSHPPVYCPPILFLPSSSLYYLHDSLLFYFFPLIFFSALFLHFSSHSIWMNISWRLKVSLICTRPCRHKDEYNTRGMTAGRGKGLVFNTWTLKRQQDIQEGRQLYLGILIRSLGERKFHWMPVTLQELCLCWEYIEKRKSSPFLQRLQENK